MGFIHGFPGVADHFGVAGLIYRGEARLEEGAEAMAEWHALDRFALQKLRFYVSAQIDDVVTNGDMLTAREYYLRLERLFLKAGAKSVASLHTWLAACHYAEGHEIFEWIARLDGIFTHFKAADAPLQDLEKKHRAMGLM